MEKIDIKLRNISELSQLKTLMRAYLADTRKNMVKLACRVMMYIITGAEKNRSNCRFYDSVLDGHWGVTIRQRDLAKALGVNERSIRRAISYLKKIGLLTIAKRDLSRNNQNFYFVDCICFDVTQDDIMRFENRMEWKKNSRLEALLESMEKTEKMKKTNLKKQAELISKINAKIHSQKSFSEGETEGKPEDRPEASARACATIYRENIFYNKNKNKNEIDKRHRAPDLRRVSEATPSGSSDGKAQQAEATRQIADARGVITNPTGERSENRVAGAASVVSCAVGIAASGAKLPEPSVRADIRARWAELESVGRQLHSQSTCTDEELYSFLGDVRRLQASCGGKIPHGLSEIEEFVQFFGRQYDSWVAEKTEPFVAESENGLETQDVVGVGEGECPDRAMN